MNTISSVNFENTEIAFKHKSNKEIFIAYLLFWLMSNPLSVKVLSNLTKLALKLNLPIDFLIKKSVYKQFCGGENRSEFEKIVTKLKQSNIGVILDYSAEAEANESSFDGTKKELLSVITYTEQNINMPFSCMKLTGIGRLSLLEKASSGEELSKKEQGEYFRIIIRLDEICKLSYEFMLKKVGFNQPLMRWLKK